MDWAETTARWDEDQYSTITHNVGTHQETLYQNWLTLIATWIGIYTRCKAYMQLLIHFHTEMVQPLKFANGEVIPSHTLLGTWPLIPEATIFVTRCTIVCTVHKIGHTVHVWLCFVLLHWGAILHVQYIPRNMHTVTALLCFVVVIHWLIFPYPSGLLHWHCGNLTIAPVPAKQPWWIWINTSCEFIMNDCATTTKQSTTKPCAYFLGYTVFHGYLNGNNICFISALQSVKFWLDILQCFALMTYISSWSITCV